MRQSPIHPVAEFLFLGCEPRSTGGGMVGGRIAPPVFDRRPNLACTTLRNPLNAHIRTVVLGKNTAVRWRNQGRRVCLPRVRELRPCLPGAPDPALSKGTTIRNV